MSLINENEQLRKENEVLRAKLDQYEQSKSASWSLKRWLIKTSAGQFLLGPRLKNSLVRVMHGDVTKDSVADLAIAVFYRLTRIGLFALLAAFIPIVLLFQQNRLLSKQNQRLDQQTALLEADRRGALIIESGNVMSEVARELAEDGNEQDTLSNALIGRIIALVRSFKPYRYLDPENDMMVGPLSPERAHLLVSLLASDLDTSTYDRIYNEADFSYADLEGASMNGSYLRAIKLRWANLNNSDLGYANLEDADLIGTHLAGGYLDFANLGNANLSSADLELASLRLARLEGANFAYANLESADLEKARLEGSCFEHTRLEDAKVNSLNWIEMLKERKCKGADWVADNYYVDPTPNAYGQYIIKKHPN